ncbi:MAG: pentapeptide repeat-containing protein [Acidimicrobiales bacterium]
MLGAGWRLSRCAPRLGGPGGGLDGLDGLYSLGRLGGGTSCLFCYRPGRLLRRRSACRRFDSRRDLYGLNSSDGLYCFSRRHGLRSRRRLRRGGSRGGSRGSPHRGCPHRGCRLRGCRLRGCRLRGCRLRGCRLRGRCHFDRLLR